MEDHNFGKYCDTVRAFQSIFDARVRGVKVYTHYT
jgi:hypothetical protein